MDSKIAHDERKHFSDRLVAALLSAGYSISPSELMQEFNMRANGATISVHAARKWLNSEAIPTQEKVTVLADWLDLSAQYLRFGEEAARTPDTAANDPRGLPRDDRMLLKDFHRLDERAQQIVRDVVSTLLKNSLRS